MKTSKCFTMPIDLAVKLEQAAEARLTSQSAIVVAALTKYFDQSP